MERLIDVFTQEGSHAPAEHIELDAILTLLHEDKPESQEVTREPEHLSSSFVQSVLDKWAKSASQSVEVLELWARNIKTSSLGGADGYNMSLVQTDPTTMPPAVTFVHWLDQQSRIGRRVKTDSSGNAIYSLAFTVPSETFIKGVVVIPDVGTRMLKRVASHRPHVADWVMRVKNMWEVSLASRQLKSAILDCSDAADASALALAGGFEYCCACDDRGMTKLTYQCACCLLGWHHGCCRGLKQQSDLYGASSVATGMHAKFMLLPAEYQAIFIGQPGSVPVCELCHIGFRSTERHAMFVSHEFGDELLLRSVEACPTCHGRCREGPPSGNLSNCVVVTTVHVSSCVSQLSRSGASLPLRHLRRRQGLEADCAGCSHVPHVQPSCIR